MRLPTFLFSRLPLDPLLNGVVGSSLLGPVVVVGLGVLDLPKLSHAAEGTGRGDSPFGEFRKVDSLF